MPLNGFNLIRAKQKLLRRQKKSLRKFLETSDRPKVIYTDDSLEFGKSCEELSWNHCMSTGIAERVVRRIKEGTSAVLLQSGLDEKGWWIHWSVTAICKICKISCLTGKHLTNGHSANPLKDQYFRFVRWSNITLFLPKTCRDCIISARESYQEYSSVMYCARGESGKKTLIADIEELEQMHASELHARRPNAKEVLTPMRGDNFTFPIADDTVKLSGGDKVLRTSTLVQDNPDRGE